MGLVPFCIAFGKPLKRTAGYGMLSFVALDGIDTFGSQRPGGGTWHRLDLLAT